MGNCFSRKKLYILSMDLNLILNIQIPLEHINAGHYPPTDSGPIRSAGWVTKQFGICSRVQEPTCFSWCD